MPEPAPHPRRCSTDHYLRHRIAQYRPAVQGLMIMPDHLIAPHGGRLVELISTPERRRELLGRAARWPSWDLSARQLCDLELMLGGGFPPLRFLGRTDYESVCARMRLADGTLWPILVTLDVPTPSDVDSVPAPSSYSDLGRRSAGRPPCRRRLATRPGGRSTAGARYLGRGPSRRRPPSAADGKLVRRRRRRGTGAAPALRLPGAAAHAGRACGPSSHAAAGTGSSPSRPATRCTGRTWSCSCARPGPPTPASSSTPWSAIPGRATSTTTPECGATGRSCPACRPAGRCCPCCRWRCAWRDPARPCGTPSSARTTGRTTSSSVAIMPDLAWTGPAGRSTTRTRPRTSWPAPGRTGDPDLAVPADGLCGGRDAYLPEDEALRSPDARHLGHQAAARARSGPSAPAWFTPAAVARELRRSRPSRAEQGVATSSPGCRAPASPPSPRPAGPDPRGWGRGVTLLDGDLVRKHLSAGLGFSKEDREQMSTGSASWPPR